jgi:L-gulonolactone oxidase
MEIEVSGIWRNWAGNVFCRPEEFASPQSVEEIADLVRRRYQSGKRVKATGSGHSFSRIAGNDGALSISLDRLSADISINSAESTVTVPSGIRLADFVRIAAENGMAPANLGAVIEQTLAGAIATGTHGTGLSFGGLADLTVGFESVTGKGDIKTISRASDPSGWAALAVGLGSLGIITRITMKCESAFRLRLEEIPAALDETLERLGEYNKARNFGFWLFPGTGRVLLRKFEETAEEPDPPSPVAQWVESALLRNGLHEACLSMSQLGALPVHAANDFVRRKVLGRSSIRVGTPAEIFTSKIRIRQHVIEFSVPYEQALPAIKAVRAVADSGHYPAHSPIDVRFCGPDEAWLGLSHGRRSCLIGCVVYQPFGIPIGSSAYFRKIDDALRPFYARPHWGKLHYRTAQDLAPLYDRWYSFLEIRDRLDPARIFSNDYLDMVLGT